VRILGLASSLALAGCVAVDHHGGIGGGIPPASTVVYHIQPGASTTVYPGTQAGYGITASAGGSYRIFWTGDSNVTGSFREFWGSVWTPGQFTSLTPGCGGVCPLEAGDFVSGVIQLPNSQRIDWDTFAADGLDGFDFVTSLEPVYFNFVIEGEHHPELVFFPGTDSGVAGFPFGLTTR
jgi:hypothetical protein